MFKFLITFFVLFILLINIHRKRLLSSSSLWIFCYELIFVFYPLFSIRSFSNESIIDVWAFIGIVCYFVGYLLAEIIKPYLVDTNQYSLHKPYFHSSQILFWITFVLFLLFMLNSLGLTGVQHTLNGSITSRNLSLGKDFISGDFFIYLMNLMVPLALAVCVSAKGKDKRKRILVVVVFVLVSVFFSYTRLYLISFIICILFWGLRKKTLKYQTNFLIISIASIVFFMVFLNFIRCLGTGNIGDLFYMLDIGYVLESTDFGASYKWFSRLIDIDSPYIFPITYLKPLFVFIPRSIWPAKPEPISLDILRMLDPTLVATGYTTAGNSVLGEGYAVLGYFGILLYPLIWGFITCFLDKRYYYRLNKGIEGSLRDCFYYLFSSFIILSCQRGDWSQYNIIIFWLFMVPLIVVSMFKFGKDNEG